MKKEPEKGELDQIKEKLLDNPVLFFAGLFIISLLLFGSLEIPVFGLILPNANRHH